MQQTGLSKSDRDHPVSKFILHTLHITITSAQTLYAGGLVTLGMSATAADTTGGTSTVGNFLRGLLSSSSVMPSSFVMPTTGGSPFFTNSCWPNRTSGQLNVGSKLSVQGLLTG